MACLTGKNPMIGLSPSSANLPPMSISNPLDQSEVANLTNRSKLMVFEIWFNHLRENSLNNSILDGGCTALTKQLIPHGTQDFLGTLERLKRYKKGDNQAPNVGQTLALAPAAPRLNWLNLAKWVWSGCNLDVVWMWSGYSLDTVWIRSECGLNAIKMRSGCSLDGIWMRSGFGQRGVNLSQLGSAPN